MTFNLQKHISNVITNTQIEMTEKIEYATVPIAIKSFIHHAEKNENVSSYARHRKTGKQFKMQIAHFK